MSRSADESQQHPVDQLSYEAAIAELEQIVNDLDEGVIDVDTLSEQFQRAIDIVENLDARISTTRQKVDQLAPRLEAIGGQRSTAGAEAETDGEEAF